MRLGRLPIWFATGYAAAGMACILIEDQVSPKRCGHTAGKQVVSRQEALARIKAAVDARNEGKDICILARTDARIISLNEAIERCKAFRALGADITFLEVFSIDLSYLFVRTEIVLKRWINWKCRPFRIKKKWYIHRIIYILMWAFLKHQAHIETILSRSRRT